MKSFSAAITLLPKEFVFHSTSLAYARISNTKPIAFSLALDALQLMVEDRLASSRLERGA